MKFFKKITHNFSKQQIFIIFILSLSDLFVFSGVLYLRYVLPEFHTYLGLDQPEFDIVLSIYGFTSLITRIPGGWLASRVSAKKMLIFSLIMTSLIGFWWTLIVQFSQYIEHKTKLVQLGLIYFCWGISIAGLFWTPLWKIVSQNVKKKEQGSAYGLQGSFLGLMGILIITLGALGVQKLTKAGYNWAFYVFAYFINSMLIICGLLSLYYIPNIKTINDKFNFVKEIKSLFEPMKIFRVWLIGFFVFGMYMFQSTFAYYMKDLIHQVELASIGSTLGITVILGGLRSYGLRFLVSNPIGKWADKWKSYIYGLLIILFIGMLAAIIFTLLPWSENWFNSLNKQTQILIFILMVILFIFIGLIGWSLLTLRFVQIGEIPINKNGYPHTLAVVSWIAFTPDAWFGYLAGALIKKNPTYITKDSYNILGLQILLSIAILCVFFGLVCGFICFQINKRELKRLNITDYRWRKLENN